MRERDSKKERVRETDSQTARQTQGESERKRYSKRERETRRERERLKERERERQGERERERERVCVPALALQTTQPVRSAGDPAGKRSVPYRIRGCQRRVSSLGKSRRATEKWQLTDMAVLGYAETDVWSGLTCRCSFLSV